MPSWFGKKKKDDEEYDDAEEEEENEYSQGEDSEEAQHDEAEQDDDEDEEDHDDWAYSTCEGNKKAVLVGIKYEGTKENPLRGCHNDVENMNEFITELYGYNEGEVRILIDDKKDPDTQPTKQNIIDALNWLVEDASHNDALFFHYSGHGGVAPDLDQDEVDGFDETIIPVDAEDASGMITDDQLHDILVKPLPKGCRLTVIFDSCHSGSALDLPYTYGPDGEVEEKTKTDHTQHALEHAAAASAKGDMEALAHAAHQMTMVASGIAESAQKRSRETKGHHADVIFLSGCLDIQQSKDVKTYFWSRAKGALSSAFTKSLRNNPEQSYHELLLHIREVMVEKGYDQTPQLSSSHPIDTSLKFII